MDTVDLVIQNTGTQNSFKGIPQRVSSRHPHNEQGTKAARTLKARVFYMSNLTT